jgi:hypothetical protein
MLRISPGHRSRNQLVGTSAVPFALNRPASSSRVCAPARAKGPDDVDRFALRECLVHGCAACRPVPGEQGGLGVEQVDLDCRMRLPSSTSMQEHPKGMRTRSSASTTIGRRSTGVGVVHDGGRGDRGNVENRSRASGNRGGDHRRFVRVTGCAAAPAAGPAASAPTTASTTAVLCDAAADFQSAANELVELDAAAVGLDGVKAALENLRTAAGDLANAAQAEFAPQVEELQQAVVVLGTTIEGLQEQTDLSSKFGAVAASISGVEQAAAPIVESARADCPSVPPVSLPSGASPR